MDPPPLLHFSKLDSWRLQCATRMGLSTFPVQLSAESHYSCAQGITTPLATQSFGPSCPTSLLTDGNVPRNAHTAQRTRPRGVRLTIGLGSGRGIYLPSGAAYHTKRSSGGTRALVHGPHTPSHVPSGTPKRTRYARGTPRQSLATCFPLIRPRTDPRSGLGR